VNDDDVALVRVTLSDAAGAQAYYAVRRALAQRLAADAAAFPGDVVEILPAAMFSVSAGLGPDDVGPGELHLLGVQVGGGWLQPPGTGRRSQAN
jgi:hypothetical protein